MHKQKSTTHYKQNKGILMNYTRHRKYYMYPSCCGAVCEHIENFKSKGRPDTICCNHKGIKSYPASFIVSRCLWSFASFPEVAASWGQEEEEEIRKDWVVPRVNNRRGECPTQYRASTNDSVWFKRIPFAYLCILYFCNIYIIRLKSHLSVHLSAFHLMSRT